MISSSADTAQSPRRRRRRVIGWLFLAVLLVPAALLLLATILVSTPSGAARAGQELSRILGQPVTIDSLRVNGVTIAVQGLTIRNVSPFPGNLLTVKSVTIAPSPRLMAGTTALALLEVRGATLALKQGPTGGWNVAPLLQRLRSRHDGGETFIDVLRIQETSLSVNDRIFPVVNFSLKDLATRGSRDASWQATFTDSARHPVTITGTAHPGISPAMTLAADAPEVALSGLAQFMALSPALDLGSGTAALHLTASLRGEALEATGNLTFNGVAARVKQWTIPLAGTIYLSGEYRTDRDEARISRLSISLAGLTTLTGTVQVRRLKSDRIFSAEFAPCGVDLGTLMKVLPPGMMKGATASGRLTLGEISLAGTARQGVTACTAAAALRNGEASWQGRQVVRDAVADLSLARAPDGWRVAGRVTSGGVGSPAELQGLDATIAARLSPQFRPLLVGVNPLSATVRGIDLAGDLRFVAADDEPFSLRLRSVNAPLQRLSPYFAGQGRIGAGTASVNLAVTAKSPEDVHGSVTAKVNGLAATSASGKTIAVTRGVLNATLRGGRNRPFAAGGSVSGNGTFNTSPAEATVTFSLTPELFHLERGSGRLGSALITFAGLQGRIPRRSSTPGANFPIDLRIERLNLASQDISLGELSGTLDGSWRTTPKGGRFEGNGNLTAGRLSWRSWSAAGLTARLVGDSTGINGDLRGTGLGGPLAASFRIAQISSEMPVSFRGSGRKLLAAEVMAAIGKPLPVVFTGGLLDADVSGSFTRTGGARLAASTAGNGLNIARNGTTMLTDVEFTAEGGYDAGHLRLRQVKVASGEKVAVTLSGEVNDLPAATRTGRFTLSLPETPLPAAVSAFARLLPGSLQEARTEGTLSVKGAVTLAEGKTTLTGELTVTGGGVALPSQQFSMEGIEGTVPVSLTLPAAEEKPSRRGAGFSRETYPRDLEQLKLPLGEPTFSIARVRFGSLEAGGTRFHLKTAGHRTELVRFETSVYGGELRGRGGFAWDRGPVYDFDLFINDLSLRRFCGTIPAIAGYLSGKVDGVVGLHGEKGGLNGILGYFDIWTRRTEDEEMLVSKEFLQKLAGKKLKGFFFRDDRPFDRGELSGHLSRGDITFSALDISHTNLFGIRDLSVSVVPTQNRISLEHLISSIGTAAKRGKPAREGGEIPPEALPQTEFKWLE